MRTILSFTILAALLLLLSACESGAKFIVHNNCSYPAYATVDTQSQVIIPAHGEHVFELDTKTQSLFTGEVKRKVAVNLKGETFSLKDVYNLWTDDTEIEVHAGEDLHAYLDPNRACIKISNNTNRKISEATIIQNDGIIPSPYAVLYDILPGESKFMRVDYYTPNDQFYYQVELEDEAGNSFTYGDASTTMLLADQQYHIVYSDTRK